jgi:hypothetical protein
MAVADMKYRKKPFTIEAIQYNSVDDINNACRRPELGWENFWRHISWVCDDLIIKTTEGNMRAGIGDWIVKGIEDEFYVVKESIFPKLYEQVE